MKNWICLCLLMAMLVGNGLAQNKLRFVAVDTRIIETQSSTGVGLRDYMATVYYSDQDPAAGDREAMRIDTTLAVSNATHSDLRIYEQSFLRFTWCSIQECGWEDIFPDVLPLMWCESTGVGGTTPASQAVNGVPADELIEFSTVTNRGTVMTWCRLTTNDPVAVFEPQADDVDVLYLFPLAGVDSTPGAFNDSLVFDIPGFCPVVDPSCFRLDLMFVLDHSGSIGESWAKIVAFTSDLIDQLSVSEQDFKVGVLRYFGGSSCSGGNVGNYTRFLSLLTTDKATLITTLADPLLRQLPPACGGGCPSGSCNTATVKGITLAMNELDGSRARAATNKAMIVITDGRGNRPGSPLTDTQTSLSYPTDEWIYDVDDCSSCGSCNGDCQADRHDAWLCVAYRQKWNTTQPTIYSVGVPDDPLTTASCGGGGSASCGTLNRIALNDGGDCPGWWPDAGGSFDDSSVHDRATLVANYDALGQVTFDLAEALTCNNPGATPCPDDCRPGGFCCGGVCVCIQNCTVNHPGDSCQTGVCATTSAGTQCIAVGKKCKNKDDPTGIIVGGVLAGLLACICLCGLLVLVALLIGLMARKSMKDVEAWEDAFQQGATVKDSALYEEKFTAVDSALYEGSFIDADTSNIIN